MKFPFEYILYGVILFIVLVLAYSLIERYKTRLQRLKQKADIGKYGSLVFGFAIAGITFLFVNWILAVMIVLLILVYAVRSENPRWKR